jgi:hypothetical protein
MFEEVKVVGLWITHEYDKDNVSRQTSHYEFVYSTKNLGLVTLYIVVHPPSEPRPDINAICEDRSGFVYKNTITLIYGVVPHIERMNIWEKDFGDVPQKWRTYRTRRVHVQPGSEYKDELEDVPHVNDSLIINIYKTRMAINYVEHEVINIPVLRADGRYRCMNMPLMNRVELIDTVDEFGIMALNKYARSHRNIRFGPSIGRPVAFSDVDFIF